MEILLPIAAFVLLGCGGGMESRPRNFNATAVGYVANLADNTVTSFLLDESSGALVNAATAATDSMPAFPIVTPDRRFLFVSNTESGTISRFSLDGNGGMQTLRSSVPLRNPSAHPGDMATDPSGKFLFVGTTSNAVEVFSIDIQTGDLKPIAGSPFSVASSATQVVLTPSGRFLYALGSAGEPDSDSIYMFSVDSQTGNLTYLGAIRTGLDPAGIAVHPSGKYVIVATLQSEKMLVYSVQDSGILNQPAVWEAKGGYEIGYPAVSADGRFVFAAAMFVNNGILAYAFDSETGKISPVAGSPFLDNQTPSSVAVSPSGKILVVSRINPGHVAAFGIDPQTGALTAISGTLQQSGIATGDTPNHVLLVRK